MKRWEREALLAELRAKTSAAVLGGPPAERAQALRFMRDALGIVQEKITPATDDSATIAMYLLHAAMCLVSLDPNAVLSDDAHG